MVTKKFILLIEDEDIMVSLLQRRLERAGYLVRVAKDGVRGLEMIHELEPDLVLLDMMLPRLNGYQVLEKLYEEKIIPRLLVIIISNSGQPIELENAMKLGVRDYLIKVNFDPEELLSKINLLFAAEGVGGGSEKIAHTRLPGSSGDILIVEDDVFLSELLFKKLSQEQYRVYRAIDVPQACQILESQHIDVMLLDIVLPGTDGLTFLKEIKQSEQYKHIPIIIISNLGQQDAVARGAEAGAADYIVKANVSPDEIIKKVAALIQKKQT